MADASLPGVLDAMGELLDALDPQVVLFGHCLFCAGLFPSLRKRFFLHYWATFLAGFGGGLLTGWFMGMQPSFFTSNFVGICWTVAWWLMNCFPFDAVRRVQSFLPFKILTKACVMVLKYKMIYVRVDDANAMYPGVLMAALFLGTLGGCGGKFTSDLVLKSAGESAGPTEFSEPTFAWRSCLINSSAYYFMVYIAEALTPAEAKTLLMTVGIVHSVLQDITGLTLDYSWPVFRMFIFGVGNVPLPESTALVAPKAKTKTQ